MEFFFNIAKPKEWDRLSILEEIKQVEEKFMGEISFIHLSDIHFRKTSGSSTDIDNDLRRAVLTDIQRNVQKELKNLSGILVGGDIAFAGQKEEYENARKFLKELTSNLCIDEKSVYCVPGNHDIDQQVTQNCISVYHAQQEIEKAEMMDDADWILDKYMQDSAAPNLLFEPIEEYNNFSAPYACNINKRRLRWIAEFGLDHDMKLKILGMNSCLISNQDDHKKKNEIRKMVIGQSQLPSYEDDTIWVSLCHHPVEFWKFADEIQSRLDKRLDVQLYGHKHEQFIDANKDRLVISAGATHPTRGKDWRPRYNGISFECFLKDGDRHILVKVFPRVLAPDRDKFAIDTEVCDSESNHFEYVLNIDEKRRRHLSDIEIGKNTVKQKGVPERPIMGGICKDIIYNFFGLSYVQQSEILTHLNLLRVEYEGKRYIEVIDMIIRDAEELGCLDEFYNMVRNKYI